MTLTATENKNETKLSPSSCCANLITNMQQAFHLVQQNLTQANLQHPNIQDIPHTFQILKTMKSFTLTTNDPVSFKQFWKGPYKIIQQISPVIVKIQDIDNPAKQKSVHISKLKKTF